MDVLIPSYTSYLAVISLPYHKRGTWRYTACDFSGGGNHSPTILTSYKNGGVFSLFLASSFYLLAVLEVSGILVLFSRPVVVLRYCFRFNWVSLLAAPFQNKRETKKPKKSWSCLATFIRHFLPTLLSRGLGGSEVEHSCIWIGGRDDAWCDASWMDVVCTVIWLACWRWIYIEELDRIGYRWGFQLFLFGLAV